MGIEYFEGLVQLLKIVSEPSCTNCGATAEKFEDGKFYCPNPDCPNRNETICQNDGY